MRPPSASSSSRDVSDEGGSGDGNSGSGNGSVASAYFATSMSHPSTGASYGAPGNAGSTSYSSPHHAPPQQHSSYHQANNSTSSSHSHSHSLSNTGSATPVSSPGTTNLNSPANGGTPTTPGGGQPSIKPKRRRADANQLRTLNATYDRTAFPSTEERADLARKLGMTPRQVQIWYVCFLILYANKSLFFCFFCWH